MAEITVSREQETHKSADIPAHVRELISGISLPSQEAAPVFRTETQVPLPETFSWGGYWQGLGVMFLLLACLWFLARYLKRHGRFNFIPRQGSLPKDAFFMEAQMPVGPRKCLMVVRFLDKRLLIGVTDQQIALLTEERVDDGVEESDFEEYSAADKR